MLNMSEEAAAERRVSGSVDATTASHTKVNVQRTCGSKGFRKRTHSCGNFYNRTKDLSLPAVDNTKCCPLTKGSALQTQYLTHTQE